MKISIVSPSFNQAAFINKTIESVASQDYEDKEHLIVDGGSTDGSIDMIREAAAKYPHIRAIIEPDNGQADAINKGLHHSSGDILAWLNTDDVYIGRDAFQTVASAFESRPEADLIYGRGYRLDPEGNKIKEAWINRSISRAADLAKSLGILQPSVFFRRSVFDRVGGLSEEYNLQLDYEFWIRLLQNGIRFSFLDKILSGAVVHEDAKSTKLRLHQLSECLQMIADRFGEVPPEWHERFGRFFATGRDEKTGMQSALSMKEDALASNIAQVSRLAFQEEEAIERPQPRRTIITAFDSKYFNQGLNLIASLHRTSFMSFDEIIVFSLGLSEKEQSRLQALERVRVETFKSPTPENFPDFFEPKGRAYKTMAIAADGLDLPVGSLVLWMDAGLSCCMDIDEVFGIIAGQDFFITDHDDSPHWPFYNIQFTHRNAAKAIGATPDELLGKHYCSCLVGYRKGGKYQALIDEAKSIGASPDAVKWPKVLEQCEAAQNKKKPSADKTRERWIKALEENPGETLATVDRLYDEFPYHGHRTQSIYSILCHRYGAPVSPAKLYHRSNAQSSRAASVNWSSGADKTADAASRRALEGVQNDTRIYHHRGTFSDLSGLLHERINEPAFVVGNGPSLRGFDFNSLRGRVWIGMNSAYRHWDRTGIYPYIYTCLDMVVQNSHKHEIKRLIQEREQLGIKWFFLRKSFCDFWPEAQDLDCVHFLEDLQPHVDWLDRGKVTTGSFSLYFCAFLGFNEIYILGVDLNYVEQLPEAESQGQELVISQSIASNPNYFFDDYQQPGDRYNPPNRHADMHLRSWNECADVLSDTPIRIYNANPESAVRCFPFVSIGKVLNSLDDVQLRALRAAETFKTFTDRQTAFRNRLLHAIGKGGERAIDFVPVLDQVRRFSIWYHSDGKSDSMTPPLPPHERSMPKHRETADVPREKHARVDETAIVAKLLSNRKGTAHTMLDVGAHHGSSARQFQPLGWSIYCFEPDPTNREKLKAKLGSAPEIKIDSRAISDKPAKGLKFYTSPESTGISGLLNFRDSHEATATVDTTTVSQIVEANRLSRIDFLKIDVEGYDYSVLKGVPWDRLKPDVIECEFEDAKTRPLGHTWKDIAEFLSSHGYHVYVSEWHPIVRYGIPHDWRRVFKYPGPPMSSDAWGNFLAFRDDPGYETVAATFNSLLKFGQKAKPEMLKRTPDRPPLQGTGKPIATSHMVAPAPRRTRLSGLRRFARVTASHIWTRKVWTLPLMAVLTLAFTATFLPPLAADGSLWRLAFLIGLLALGLLYIAFRCFAALTIMRKDLKILQQQSIVHKTFNDQKKRIDQLGKTVEKLESFIEFTEGMEKQLNELTSSAAETKRLKKELSDYSASTDRALKRVQAQLGRIDALDASLAQKSTYLSGLEERVEGIEQADLSTHMSRLETVQSEMDATQDKLSSALEDLETALKAFESDQSELSSNLKAQISELAKHDKITGEKLGEIESRQDQFETGISAKVGELAKHDETADEKLREIEHRQDQFETGINEKVGELQIQGENEAEKLENLFKINEQIRSHLDSLAKWKQFNNAAWFQHFNRELKPEHIQKFEKEWPKRLSMPISKTKLGYMAARACEVEKQLDGRLATSVEDILLRSVVARSIKGKSAEILEIGTLFGTGVAIMFDAMANHFDHVHFTLLDPLEGYYNASQADILTGQPVDERTLRRNLQRVGMREENFTLIKMLSTEPKALEEAAKQKYDLLVIDGDHSYAGVKTDFENYAHLVKLGGYIIFDDYASQDWPEVQEYVDSELANSDFVSRVGASWRTCVYRVVKSPTPAQRRRDPSTAKNTGVSAKTTADSES